MPISKNHKKKLSHKKWKTNQNIIKSKRRYANSPKRWQNAK